MQAARMGAKASSARLSLSTFITRSPKMPSCLSSVWAAMSELIFAASMFRIRAMRDA